MNKKIIAHIDMDAFFASVEEVDQPYLRGLPIVVGSDPQGGNGRGVVSTANYIAREYGIGSALPIQKAWQYSETAKKSGKPAVIFVSGRSARYKEVSDIIFGIVNEYTNNIQITSIDEAYIDLSYLHSFKKAGDLAKTIKEEIATKTKLTCSIGIGSNKMIAKIASDFIKPNGLTIVKENQTLDFLEPLAISKIPGVGPKTQNKLHKIGIYTIKDAHKFSWEDFEDLFGKYGFDLYQKVRGIGSTDLSVDTVSKSIGIHETFSKDTGDLKYVCSILKKMVEDIYRTMEQKEFNGFRTIVFTIRFSDFETITRSLTSDEIVLDKETFYYRGVKLVLPFFDKSGNPGNKKIRMVGLRIEKLV